MGRREMEQDSGASSDASLLQVAHMRGLAGPGTVGELGGKARS
jgi:hypothetical protein